VFFEPAHFGLNDRDGVPWDFVTEDTYAQTATLVIDHSETSVRRFTVAATVDRSESGEPLGARLGDVLDTVGVEYETIAVERRDPRWASIIWGLVRGRARTDRELQRLVAPDPRPDDRTGG